MVEIKRDFHYCRSGEYEQATLSIYNANAERAIRRRLEFYAILEVIVYKELTRVTPSGRLYLRTSRAESYGITKLNDEHRTPKHEPQLGMHWSLGSPESLFGGRVNDGMKLIVKTCDLRSGKER